MFSWITSNLLWTQGSAILAVLIAVGFFGLWKFRFLTYLAIAGFIFSFYFFRNPERVCLEAQQDSSILICPADGAVVDVAYDAQNSFNGYAQKVSIFLSPLDVHVNWMPMAGTIEKISYVPGSFVPAFLPKSSLLNEHTDVVIRDDKGRSILVRQIAGTVARRICWWIYEGDSVTAGEKYGMIRFGSRVDIFMPESVEIMIGMGQRVLGGQTVLGRWQ